MVALLHDLCKVGCYKKTFRNVKDDATGKWEKVPSYQFDDPLPYGHGEKSVYIANGFIRLTREGGHGHPLAHGFLRFGGPLHRGPGPAKIPLAFALATADMEASYFLEGGALNPCKRAAAPSPIRDWSAAAFFFIPPACRPRDCGSVGPVCRNPTASRCWAAVGVVDPELSVPPLR